MVTDYNPPDESKFRTSNDLLLTNFWKMLKLVSFTLFLSVVLATQFLYRGIEKKLAEVEKTHLLETKKMNEKFVELQKNIDQQASLLNKQDHVVTELLESFRSVEMRNARLAAMKDAKFETRKERRAVKPPVKKAKR